MAKLCPTCGKTFDDRKAFCPDDMSTLQSSDEDTLVGTIIADRYLVTGKLGEGGMGRVYRAQHVLLEKRQAAIKVLHPALLHDSDSLTRFKREASNASSINNSHVAQVYDFGEAGEGLVYLAIEYIAGETLSAVIKREAPLAPARVANLVAQIADGLDAAHKLGIVHRDLKPDNILVTRDTGGDEEVKVVDFGIAKAIEGEGQRVTKTGFVTGTLEYMSPEQITGGDVDGRSDEYALALVACEMLTGALPFPAARAEQSMMMRLTEDPKRLHELRADGSWPDGVQEVIDRGLARAHEDRYPGAGAFARALSQAVNGTPASQTVPPTLVRRNDAPASGRASPSLAPSAAPAKRRVSPLAIGAVVAVVVVGGVGAALMSRGRGTPSASVDSAAAIRSPVTTAATSQPATQPPNVPVPPISPTNGGSATTAPSTGATSQPATSPATTDPKPLSRPAPSSPIPASAPPVAPKPGGASSTSQPASNPVAAAEPSVTLVLDSLEKALDPQTATARDARAAEQMLRTLLPRLQTREQHVRAELYRAEAFMLSDQADRACSALTGIAKSGAGTAYQKQIELYMNTLKCQ